MEDSFSDQISFFSKKAVSKNISRMRLRVKKANNFLNAYSEYKGIINSEPSREFESKEKRVNIRRRIKNLDFSLTSNFPLPQEEKIIKLKSKERKNISLKKYRINIDDIFKTHINFAKLKNQSMMGKKLEANKFSGRSVEIINKMNNATNFIKRTFNFIFPTMYDLKLKQRVREAKHKMEKSNTYGYLPIRKLKKKKETQKSIMMPSINVKSMKNLRQY